MNFLEKHLEEIIYTSDKDELLERGLYFKGKLFRQLRIGNYGVADLVAIQRPYYNPYEKSLIKGTITVFELKRYKINYESFFQALSYLTGIKDYINTKHPDCEFFNFSIILIGNEIETSGSFCYLSDFTNANVYDCPIESKPVFNFKAITFDYKLDGIWFDDDKNYKLINKGF